MQNLYSGIECKQQRSQAMTSLERTHNSISHRQHPRRTTHSIAVTGIRAGHTPV